MKKKNGKKEDKRKNRASVPCNCYLSFLISALLIPFADVEKEPSFLLSFPYLRKQKKKYDFLSLLVGFEENACNNEDVH